MIHATSLRFNKFNWRGEADDFLVALQDLMLGYSWPMRIGLLRYNIGFNPILESEEIKEELILLEKIVNDVRKNEQFVRLVKKHKALNSEVSDLAVSMKVDTSILDEAVRQQKECYEEILVLVKSVSLCYGYITKS